MPKPTEQDKDRFRALVPEGPGVEVRPMFGNLAAFVNGNIFLCLLGADVGVKLDRADAEALTAAGGGPFGPGATPMAGYVTLPATWRTSPAEAEPWIAKARSTAAALPPKVAKKKAKKA
ncbi:MAG TPA: TfoX/Sxy family protein [Acidimicrobiales bacterium]|nr:TfoX/Sxy family protein [Acidimicrobiales bacterium]